MSTGNSDYQPIRINSIERGSGAAGDCNRSILMGHYLHKMPDARTSYEIYEIELPKWSFGPAGYLVFGRPQCTVYKGWFGSVDDVKTGVCEVTRWQVLNLARVWINPNLQTGGKFCEEGKVPGFRDRKGMWRSTLASAAILKSLERVKWHYLVKRPPVFLEEPYELRWLLSYCDTKLHKGTIYQAAGFEPYSINEDGIQTWRLPLPRLTRDEDKLIQFKSQFDKRGIKKRAERNQMRLAI